MHAPACYPLPLILFVSEMQIRQIGKSQYQGLMGNFTQIWPKYLLINIGLVSDFPRLPFHFLRQRSLSVRIGLKRKDTLSKIFSTSPKKSFQLLLSDSIYTMRTLQFDKLT